MDQFAGAVQAMGRTNNIFLLKGSNFKLTYAGGAQLPLDQSIAGQMESR
jgi:hypothetical protein